MPGSRRAFAFFLALSISSAAKASSPPPPPPASGLSLASITIEPAAVAADTLCRLRVEIRNSTPQPVSYLVFRVRVGGHQLPVYDKLVTLQTLPAAASTEVRLYNFWSSETGRPFPADGNLTVDVSLLEARWVRLETKDGEEVTTPLATVPGLPVSRSVALRAPPAN